MSLGQLVLELSLDGSEFTMNLKRADGQLAKFLQNADSADKTFKRVEHQTRSWGHALRDSVVVLSLIRSAINNVSDAAFGWQRAIVGVNSQMEKSIQLMRNFSTETDSAKATAQAIGDVNKLLDRAATSPFSLDSITSSFVKLRVAGLQPAERSLNTLIDSVAAFGGTDQNLERAAVALQQMGGKGVVSMEELRQQLGESVPTAINAMADALGTSYSDLVKQISLGRVQSKPAIQAMMEELARSFDGTAASMMDTWGGAVAQFETNAKRLALAIGGLGEDGYTEDGYFKTLTNELNSLTDILSSPEMLQSAKEFGQALAEIVKTAAEGIRWVIEHREAIYEWGKAFLYLAVAVKGTSIIGGVLNGIGSSMTSMALQMALARKESGGMGQAARTLGSDLLNFRGPATAASEVLAGMGMKAGAVRTGLSALSGALGVITGPLGLVAAAAVAGSFAWVQYRQEVVSAREEVLKLNGALTNNAQLKTLEDNRKELENKLAGFGSGFVAPVKGRGGVTYDGYETEAEYEAAKKKVQDELNAVNENILKGELNLAEVYGDRKAAAEILAIEKQAAKVSQHYKISRKKLEDQRELGKEGKEGGITEAEYQAGLIQVQMLSEQDRLDHYLNALAKTEQAKADLEDQIEASPDSVTQDMRIALQAADNQIAAYSEKVTEVRDRIEHIGKTTLESTIVGGGSGTASKAGKNPLAQFLDSTSRAAARAAAAAESANPKLAELNQLVANMQANGQSVDQGQLERAREAAIAWYEEAEAKKALKEATTLYTDSLERLNQIEAVVGGKTNKAENENPWLKATADAQKYQDEIVKIQAELDEAIRKMGSGEGTAEAKANIESLEGNIDSLSLKIEKLGITSASKALREKTDEIKDSMLTQTELIEAAYQEQLTEAQAYFEKLKETTTAGAEDWAAYYAYLEALRAKHAQDNESGLDSWIRENKDAADEYKSLWGSAMDSFTDTVADGLVEGKFAIHDFVEGVLKDLLRVQIAKQMASIGDSMGGMEGIAKAIGGYFGGAAAGGSGYAGSAGNMADGNAKSIGFANGGIMTQWGSAKLKEYAKGGIANSPQVAVFGEGSQAEAYVPLPDGRSIPVTMKASIEGQAGGSRDSKVAPNVAVNVINQSGTQMNAEQTGQGFNGEQFVVDVVLKAVNRPGPLRDAVRG